MVALAPDPAATVTVDATWAATPSAFATGYRLERWKGASLEDTQTITPASTTSSTDTTAAADTTYQYRLDAAYENWTSAVLTATVTTGCAPAGATSLWARNSEATPLAASWLGDSVVSRTITAPVGEWRIMQAATSTDRDEVVAVGVDVNRKITAETRVGGIWAAVAPNPLATASESFWWGFDVAYEQQTGEAMVVYGRNGPYLRHRTWDGSWSNETSLLPPTGVTGDVRWITVATDPNSDRLAFSLITRDNEIWLTSWTGTYWQNGPKVTNQAASQIAPVTAIAFESLTGEILVTYGEDTAVPADDRFVHYRLWNPTSGTITAELDGPDLGDRPNSMMLDPRPGSDEIMLGVQDDDSDLNYARWDGTGFGSSVQIDGDPGEVKNQPFAWLWH